MIAEHSRTFISSNVMEFNAETSYATVVYLLTFLHNKTKKENWMFNNCLKYDLTRLSPPVLARLLQDETQTPLCPPQLQPAFT